MEKKTVSVSLRLTESQRSALTEITERTKLSQAALIDVAIEGLIEYSRMHRGRLVLPLDFTSVWREMHDLEREVTEHLSRYPLPEESPSRLNEGPDPKPTSSLSPEGRADVGRAMKSAADKRRKGSSSRGKS